ncbi:MAG: hypothetical protein Kow00129_12900 [Thermoleophilia bacterium]
MEPQALNELIISALFVAFGLLILTLSGPAAEFFGRVERSGDREIYLARRALLLRGWLFTLLGVAGLLRWLYGG